MKDVDECQLEDDNCHVNATCVDTIGSFVCNCNNGFEGDGVNCAGKTKFEYPALYTIRILCYTFSLAVVYHNWLYFILVQISTSVREMVPITAVRMPIA